jgi:hypothetical protein
MIFPILARIAAIVLAVPATSGDVERTFLEVELFVRLEGID